MTESADLSEAINFRTFLFENSSEYHLVEHLMKKSLIKLFDRRDLGFSPFLIFGFGLLYINHIGHAFRVSRAIFRGGFLLGR